jgi:hypothetical protein
MGNVLLRCVLGFVIALVMAMHAGATGRVMPSAKVHFTSMQPCAQLQTATAYIADDQPDSGDQDSRPPRKTFCKIDMTHAEEVPAEGAIPAAPLASPQADSPAVVTLWPVSEKPPNLRNL